MENDGRLTLDSNIHYTAQLLPLKLASVAKGVSVLLRSRINPVTGVVEEEQPDPMEGMTEEQKEYEAIKLIQMFEKLSR